MLSGGTAFRDDEIGMTRSNPRCFHSGQLFEPTHFVFVRPDDQVFSRGRATGMDPSLFDPVMDLSVGSRRVREPGRESAIHVFAADRRENSLRPTPAPASKRRPPFGKDAAAARWDEALGVELVGDGPAVQSLPMKLFQPFGETLVVFQAARTCLTGRAT